MLNEGTTSRIAFISYYKGEYSIRTLERKEPLHTAASADFGAPGPIIDFQAPLQHTLVEENQRKKGTFEKMFLEGRPPVNVGVTNNGDVFGGTQISFGDVLGDKQFNLFAASISQYRTLSLSYVNLSRRFQFALQGYSQTQFFYGQLGGAVLRSGVRAVHQPRRRDGDADGARRQRVRHLSVQPLPPRGVVRRPRPAQRGVQRSGAAGARRCSISSELYGTTVFRNGTLMPLGVAFIQETTIFREFGPLAGNTMRSGLRRRAEDRQPAVAPDLRRRRPPLPAARRQRPAGDAHPRLQEHRRYPDFMYFGGNSELRGYDYLQFAGQNVVFANAELRFPLIEAALTPIGVIGGIRGVFFANIGGAWFNDQPSTSPCVGEGERFKFFNNDDSICRVPTGYQVDGIGNLVTVVDPNTGVETPVLNYAAERGSTASGCRTPARRTASASRPSRSASRFTSTGRGARCSTRTGKTWCSPARPSTDERPVHQRRQEFRKPRFAVWDRLRLLRTGAWGWGLGAWGWRREAGG